MIISKWKLSLCWLQSLRIEKQHSNSLITLPPNNVSLQIKITFYVTTITRNIMKLFNFILLVEEQYTFLFPFTLKKAFFSPAVIFIFTRYRQSYVPYASPRSVLYSQLLINPYPRSSPLLNQARPSLPFRHFINQFIGQINLYEVTLHIFNFYSTHSQTKSFSNIFGIAIAIDA